MSVNAWRTDANAPFHTLLRVLHTYVHPEADADAYDEFKERVHEAASDDTELQVFKAELGRALRGIIDGLHPDAIFDATSYDDGSDEAFLRRLWTDLYPGQPVPQPQDSDRD